MHKKLIPINALADMLNVGRSTIYAWVKAGILPPPLKISDGCSRWELETIEEWLRRKRGG